MASRRRYDVRQHPAAMRALSLALMVATWRGPIPCIHVHDRHPEHAEGQLALHIQAYHAAEPADAAPDWHVHFMLPQDVMSLGDCPSPEPVPEDPLLAQQTVVQLAGPSTSVPVLLCNSLESGGHFAAVVVDTAAPFAAAYRLRDDVVCWGGSFSTSLLSAAPLCAVTGVALC